LKNLKEEKANLLAPLFIRRYTYATWWNLNGNNQLAAKSAYDATVHFLNQGKAEFGCSYNYK
jgi:acyl-CoA-binding protein